MIASSHQMGDLFGTDGIRGRANQYPITPEVALKAGRALARIVVLENEGAGVIIGRDTRRSGVMLESALAAGLTSEGVNVQMAGVLPTPALAYLTRSSEAVVGVMLTASHNPHVDNGIKIFAHDGFKISDDQEAAIEQFLLAHEPVSGGEVIGEITLLEDATNRYRHFAQQACEGLDLYGRKIVIDCAHGAGFQIAPEVLRQLGAEVIALAVEPDGLNINEGVGSLHPEKAAEEVIRQGADLGICLDGDADRVIFIDGAGQVVNGDRVICLSALALHRRGGLMGNSVVATVMSNLGLRDALSAHGVELEVTGVGDRLVLERMRESGFVFGGENSGHLIFSQHATTGDGLMSALMVLSFMEEEKKSLTELADCMDEYAQHLVNIPVSDKPPLESVPEIRKAMEVVESDLGNSGRILVRYSGTEKKLRVMVEARESDRAAQLCQKIVTAAQLAIGA